MRRLIKSLAATGLLALSAVVSLAHGYKVGDLEIGHPFSKAMLAGSQVAGGFMKITNSGSTSDRLVKVSTDFAGMVQLHEMKVEDGVMKMAEIPGGIEIPAGQTVELKPGGLHVMFMNVPTPSKEGDKIKAVLTFEKAGTVEVEFAVGPANPDASQHQHKHDHSASADMPQSDDPQEAIPAVMKEIFETPENKLTVNPVVVQGDFAVAGWVQEGKGGRALLKKGHKGWAIHLCSGDSLKEAANLAKVGMSEADAKTLADNLAAAESSIDAKTLELFASFEGTVMMDGHQ